MVDILENPYGHIRVSARAHGLRQVVSLQIPDVVSIAEIVSELVDTEVYRRWVVRFADRHQWGRVLSSNAVAIPIDSIVFAVIAFGGEIPASAVVAIVWGNILVKGLVTAISMP